MSKPSGCLVLLAACGYPALPAVGGGQDDAAIGAPGEPDAATDAGAGIDAPDGAAAPTPRVDVSVDHPTITTELMTSNPIVITVRGADGFTGSVALAAEATDAAGVAIPGWTVNLGMTSVNVPLDGTATTTATLVLPPKKTALIGTVKVTATAAGTVGNHAASAAITVVDQVTWLVHVDAGTMGCIYPANAGTTAAPVTIGLGTKVRFFNNGTAELSIHSSGIIAHQVDTTPANTAYEQTPTGVGSAIWYCHAPGPNLGAADPEFVVQ